MANIYDIATIKSGDPLGLAGEGAREASTVLERYRHQKEIIEEINKEIKEAKKKQKKDKWKYGLLGSLLGMGLSAAVPGVAGAIGKPLSFKNSWMPNLISAIGGGVGGGVLEKYRQDKMDATAGLEALEKKYKGRDISKSISDTIDTFDETDKAMLAGDILSNLITGGISPSIGIQEANAIAPKGATPPVGIPNKAIGQFLPQQINTELAEGVLPMLGKIPGWDELATIDNELLSNLLRLGGPAAYSEYASPTTIASPYQGPQFRNPYRGGY
jgi:hypothetical protein